MPHYSDYHRTVIGSHGTRLSTALKVVTLEQPIGSSENQDDWLSHGVYFWEYAPQQAWLWAKQRQKTQRWDEEVAVVASMIRLGNCFDLLDPENVRDLGEIYRRYLLVKQRLGLTAPVNFKSRKRLRTADSITFRNHPRP